MQLEHWIAHAASRAPDKVAIRYQGDEISYAQLEHLVGRLAWLLRHRFGIEAGQRVAHLALNSPLFLALVFACARIGAILVPLNYRLARPELAHLLDDAGPSVLLGQSALLTECIAYDLVPPRCRLVSFDTAPRDCVQLAAHLEGAETEPSRPVASDPSAPLLIVYTSGTTGRPKGAVLDQNALRGNALHSQSMHALTADDHVLTALPFFHVGGINVQTLPALYCGATVTLLPTFDPNEVLAMLAETGVTLTVLVPTQMQAIAALPQWPGADLSRLRAVTTGSTTVDSGLLEVWQAHGVRTLQVYGCTESSPIAIHQDIAAADTPIDSVGRAAKYCDVRIVDEEGKPVPPMTRGELELKGPNVMRGYWNNPEATAAALRGGWLATGDIGYRDQAGHYYVVDRIKNVIITGGENVYPAEIERVLLEHPNIAEAAVVGLPDRRWGETVAAAIVTSVEDSLDETAVIDCLEGKVARYKLPRRVAFLNELPRNTMGKTDYDAVRSRLIARA